MNSAREKAMNGISERAADWHLLYSDGQPTPEQDREYLRWLRTSPQHVGEALRIGLLDITLRRSGLGRSASATSEPTIVAFPPSAVRRDPPAGLQDESKPARRRRVLPWPVATAAGAALVAVLLMLLVSIAPVDLAVSTARGEWTRQPLEDSSVAHVAPSSELRTRFTEELRSLALLRGEALFDVAKQPGRPFIVATELGTVTAVGTHFGISHREDQVVVTVLEGEVAVRPKRRGRPEEPPISLTANQQLVLSPVDSPRLIDPVDALRELKWLQNWVEADGDTVARIVRELNRRNRTQIVIEDPNMSRFRVYAFGFDPSRPEDLVEQANQISKGLAGRDDRGESPKALRLEQP